MPATLTMLLLPLACLAQRHQGEVASPPSAEAGSPAVAEADPARSEPPIPSVWESEPCQGRDYSRTLRLAGGGFTATDPVSPCPPGARCVWSGIVTHMGTLSLDGTDLHMQVERTMPPSGSWPFPTLLTWSDGRLREPGTDCAYELATEETPEP